MLLNLSEHSDEPLHAQISRQIRAKVLSERLPGGTALPSIRSLAKEQRVSVITVQRAYDDLEREGLLRSRPSKGFWVETLPADGRQALARSRFADCMKVLVCQGAAEGLTQAVMRLALEESFRKGARS